MALVDHVAVELVAIRLTRLREQDQRRGVRGLRREDQVEQDEGSGVPVPHERGRVQCDPERDDNRLPDDVPRRAEEARGLLGEPAESVVAERAEARHGSRLRHVPDDARLQKGLGGSELRSQSWPWRGAFRTPTVCDKLQALTDAALAHLELDALLPTLLLRTREILDVDTCAVLLLDEETNELVARAAVGIEEEVEQGVRIPVGGGFAGRVAADRRPVILDDVDHADVLNPILREKGIKSMLGVPLLVGGRVLGVLHVGVLAHRVFDDDDVELLQLAGDRAAIAIEHARAFEAERQARQRVEHVQAVTDAALAHLELDDLFAVLLPRIRDILEADTCAVLLVDEGANELVARAAVGIEEEVEQGVRIPVGRGFAGRIAAERRPVILDDVDHADVLNPILREKGIKSMLGVPLLVAGDALGVIHVGTLVHRRFTSEDVELLTAGRRPGRACDRACAAPRADGAAR